MIEVRVNSDGSVDELVADCSSIHLEQLNTGTWYLRVSTVDDVERFVTLNLTPKRGFVYESDNVLVKCTDSAAEGRK